MNTLPSSKPSREEVDIYKNDKNKTIVPINSGIYGRFTTDFESLLRLKVNDVVIDDIPF